MEAFENLIKELKKLPGIGSKGARRIAFFLLQQEEEYLTHLGETLSTLRKSLHPCSECGNISDKDPCNICSDPLRDKKVLCVVEDFEALSTFEHAGIYNGLYHVLNTKPGTSEDEDLTDEDIKFFVKHVKSLKPEEIIMATNPKIESDIVYYTLLEALKGVKGCKNMRITRLASGLPVGGDIAFADRITLHTALQARTQIEL